MARWFTYVGSNMTLEFNPAVYAKLQQRYQDISKFLPDLESLIQGLIDERETRDINPYGDTVHKGIYLLGLQDTQLRIFPQDQLALKCSQGKAGTENLRRQFCRSLQLSKDFVTKLNPQEQQLLSICPVYLHVQSHRQHSFFQQILFMERLDGSTIGETERGFSEEFCRVFHIPSLEEIRHQPQWALHRRLDPQKHRQLLKIQTLYLFRHLWQRGIKILSLNQKNILACSSPEGDRTHYVIIDPIPDYSLPVSPSYNLISSLFICPK